MKLSGKNHISILTRLLFFFISSLSFLSFHPSIISAQGSSNLFNCNYEPGYGCTVKYPTDCAGGYQPVDSVCTSITDFSTCNDTINQACQEVYSGTYYKCGPLNTCTPCTPGNNDPLCVYTSCDACNVTPKNWQCNSGGCIESNCNPDTNPDTCFKDAGVCSSFCIVVDPYALGPNQYVCNLDTHTCNNSCDINHTSDCSYSGVSTSCIGPSTPQPCIAKQNTGGGGRVDPTGSCGEGFIDTALGCIPYEYQAFVPALLGFLATIIGAIALVVMLIGTITIMTASGNPEAVKKGKELFTGAITGLLFIIFSVVILKMVAGDIIKLPGFIK